MLRSILRQLFQQKSSIPDPLLDLFKKHKPFRTKPSLVEWKAALRSVLEMTGQSFILIDALDECPVANNERQDLMELLKTIHGYGLPNVHILATSRKEQDIEQALAPIISIPPVGIQNTVVDEDIRTYVTRQLTDDPFLKNWPQAIQMEIEKKLVEGSFGM
jgi:hypothetical protein